MPQTLEAPERQPTDLTTPPAVSIRHLTHHFGQKAGSKQILFDLNLDVAASEIVLLRGPSGCGKTTVLTLVGGLRSVQSGSVSTIGQELAGVDQRTLTMLRRQIGFIFQSGNLHASLTAIENVRMSLEVHGADALVEWRERCQGALAAVGLDDRAQSFPSELSGGQKQRVAIARAFVAQPRLILADEPTAALDRQTGRQAVLLLRDHARAQGSAILMVTHDDRILDIADRILEMDDGRIAQPAARG